MAENKEFFEVESADDSPGFSLWQVSSMWQRQINASLKQFDLTHPQFVLLASLTWLVHDQNPITQAELAFHTKMDVMNASNVLRTMEDKGLILRNPHPTDTRAKSLVVTARGLKLAGQAVRVVEGIDRAFFNSLGTDVSSFNQQLLKLIRENTPSPHSQQVLSPLIRREAPGDITAIHQVNAFAFNGEAEANLVDQLRTRGAGLLSLVAEVDGQVVGQIYFSPVSIISGDGLITPAVGLAPLAVLPAFQNRGIGSSLVRAGLDELRRMGHKLVFVLGHAGYYPRFGFNPSLPYGIRWEFEVDEAHFMVAELQPGALAGVQGLVRYQPEFNGV